MEITPSPDTSRKTLLCVDSYDNGVPRGRIFHGEDAPEMFESLSQCLLLVEALLNESGQPQSYTTPRTFTAIELLRRVSPENAGLHRGALATFDLRVLFRRNASWQGNIVWLEKGAQRSFRSVLELITLLDTALRA